MADATQYAFEFSDLAKLMFQSQSIHEGRWVIGLEFNVAIGQLATGPSEAFPGAIITTNRLILSAVTSEPSPPNLTFDAAELNPKKVKSTSK